MFSQKPPDGTPVLFSGDQGPLSYVQACTHCMQIQWKWKMSWHCSAKGPVVYIVLLICLETTQSYLLHCIISYINLFLCDLSHFQTGIFFALYYIFTYKFINDKVMHMCMHTLILSYYITHMCTCITHTHTHTLMQMHAYTHVNATHNTCTHIYKHTNICVHACRQKVGEWTFSKPSNNHS